MLDAIENIYYLKKYPYPMCNSKRRLISELIDIWKMEKNLQIQDQSFFPRRVFKKCGEMKLSWQMLLDKNIKSLFNIVVIFE